MEYSALKRWLDVVGQGEEFSFVDIASSNGVSQSAIWPFLHSEMVPTGLAAEIDSGKFARLAAIYADFPGIGLARAKVTPENVCSLLDGFKIQKDFSLLNIDIDSYDLDLLGAILSGGWRPTVISIEINEKIPPPIFFQVHYSPDHFWAGDHFYGCSFTAAAEMLESRTYQLVDLAGNNLIAVHSSKLPGQVAIPSSDSLYYDGYANIANRRALFHYNRDVDHWLESSADSALEEIADYFSAYPPESFELRLT